MPMTLWSRLKMYFRMKLWWYSCAACSAVCVAAISQAPRVIAFPCSLALLERRLLLGQPGVKRLLRLHMHLAAHRIVPNAAQLGAGDLELSLAGRREPRLNGEFEIACAELCGVG